MTRYAKNLGDGPASPPQATPVIERAAFQGHGAFGSFAFQGLGAFGSFSRPTAVAV